MVLGFDILNITLSMFYFKESLKYLLSLISINVVNLSTQRL